MAVRLKGSERSLGFDAIGEHTGDDHDRNIMVPFGGKPPGSEGPGRNRLPTVPFSGKTIDSLFSFTGRYFRARGGINKELFDYVIFVYLFAVTGRPFLIASAAVPIYRRVYLSERGAVVSPQAGTYEYPFLVVGAAPVSHPTALEKSAYRRFVGPSRTSKKRLLDHPLRHKHRDALPPTTSRRRVCVGARTAAPECTGLIYN
ncbi:hypothetical protein M5K25_021213 [Dendrobium thyrsiflorum]|uniref:Uncharacterized protein n=1 Tax=Dendrobium thyrsiflorum TaxID=117978 RepID=A0ABD0UCL6_DENTH